MSGWADYGFPNNIYLAPPLQVCNGLISALNERREVVGLSQLVKLSPLSLWNVTTAKTFFQSFENVLNATIIKYVNHTINDGDFTGLTNIPLWTKPYIYEYLEEDELIYSKCFLSPLLWDKYFLQKYRVINLLKWVFSSEIQYSDYTEEDGTESLYCYIKFNGETKAASSLPNSSGIFNKTKATAPYVEIISLPEGQDIWPTIYSLHSSCEAAPHSHIFVNSNYNLCMTTGARTYFKSSFVSGAFSTVVFPYYSVVYGDEFAVTSKFNSLGFKLKYSQLKFKVNTIYDYGTITDVNDLSQYTKPPLIVTQKESSVIGENPWDELIFDRDEAHPSILAPIPLVDYADLKIYNNFKNILKFNVEGGFQFQGDN